MEIPGVYHAPVTACRGRAVILVIAIQRPMKGACDIFTSTAFAINPRMSYVSKQTEDVDPGFWRPKVSPAKAAAKKAEKSGE
jgi:hypothetical protein